jgi:Tfp pilus assembly protein PilV
MKIINFNKDQKGISIIELLIAIAVIVMVIVSVTLLTTKSVQLAQFSQDRQKATTLANEAIETVRFNRDTQTWNNFINNNFSNIELTDDDRFSWTIDVTNGSGGALDFSDTLASVVITINWEDSKGEHGVVQQTSLTKY